MTFITFDLTWSTMAGRVAFSFPRQRIFLCNWYVKLVKPGTELPNNHVQCHVPMKMTKFDIRNYFEKIYGVKVSRVNTRIQLGKVKKGPSNIPKKQADTKIAYVILEDETFEFPDLLGKYSREDFQ